MIDLEFEFESPTSTDPSWQVSLAKNPATRLFPDDATGIRIGTGATKVLAIQNAIDELEGTIAILHYHRAEASK